MARLVEGAKRKRAHTHIQAHTYNTWIHACSSTHKHRHTCTDAHTFTRTRTNRCAKSRIHNTQSSSFAHRRAPLWPLAHWSNHTPITMRTHDHTWTVYTRAPYATAIASVEDMAQYLKEKKVIPIISYRHILRWHGASAFAAYPYCLSSWSPVLGVRGRPIWCPSHWAAFVQHGYVAHRACCCINSRNGCRTQRHGHLQTET
jgi:hypothetical protein